MGSGLRSGFRDRRRESTSREGKGCDSELRSLTKRIKESRRSIHRQFVEGISETSRVQSVSPEKERFRDTNSNLAFTIGQSFLNENQMRRSPQSFGNTLQKESVMQNLEIFNKLYPVSLRPADDYKLT